MSDSMAGSCAKYLDRVERELEKIESGIPRVNLNHPEIAHLWSLQPKVAEDKDRAKIKKSHGDQTERILALYNDGKGVPEIASIVGFHEATVRDYLHSAGIYQRKAKKINPAACAAKYRKIKAWRVASGRTVKEACEKYGITQHEYYQLARFERVERIKA
jgi:hypothetical protein